MRPIFPYLSFKNIQRLFSRQKMELRKKPALDSTASLIEHLGLTLERADVKILGRFGSMAARGLSAPSAFICSTEGDICWQASDSPLSIDPIKPDVLTHVSKASSAEVAVIHLRQELKKEGETGVARFCAIAPLRTSHGKWIGALCVFDEKERPLSGEEKEYLKQTASQLVETLELQETARQCALCRNATEAISHWILSHNGERWLEQLSMEIAELAQVEYVIVAERVSEKPAMARTVCVCFQQGHLENFDYSLDRSPIESLKPGEIRCHSSGVLKLFPDDAKLKSLGIEGFAAICLVDSAGKPSGFLAVMDRKPFRNRLVVESILTAAAAPIAARLEEGRLKGALDSEMKSHRGSIEHAMEGIYQISSEGKLLQANPAFARMLGYRSAEDLQENTAEWSAIYAETDRRKKFLEQLRAANEMLCDRWHVKHKNGGKIWVVEQVRPVRAMDGKLLHFEGRVQDITAQLLAEESFRASDSRFQTLFQHGHLAMAIADRTGVISKANTALEKMLGCKPGEIKFKALADFMPEEESRAAAALLGELADKKREEFRLEKELTRKDRSRFWGRITAIAVRDTEGALVSALLFVDDITAQKETEELFQARSVLFQSVFQGTPQGMLVTDASGRVSQVNPALKHLAPGLEGKPIADLFNEEDRERYGKLESECKSGKRDRFQFEARMKAADKKLVWLLLTVSAVKGADGVFQYFVGMVEDVTARKETEKALSGCDAPVQALIEGHGWGMAMTDADGEIKKVNKAFQRFLDRSEDSLLSKSFADLCAAEDRSKATDLFKKLESGPARVELRMSRKDRSQTWARVSASAMKRSDGSLLSVFLLVEDIGELRAKEAALEHGTKRFEELFEVSVPVAFLDGKGAFLKANKALQRIAGFSCDELRCRSVADLMHPDDREGWEKLEAMFADAKSDFGSVQGRLRGKNGRPVWVEFRLSRVHGNNGSDPRMICVLEDLTARKEGEEALVESRRRFRQLFDEGSIGMAAVDASGNLMEVNRVLEEMAGAQAQQLQGKPAASLMGPEDQANFSSMIGECIEGKRERFGAEMRMGAQQGSAGVRVTGSVARRKDGAADCVLVMFENLTALRELQDRLEDTGTRLQQTEERLHSTEGDLGQEDAYFRALFDGAGVGIALVDQELRFIETNPELQRLLGHSDAELKNKTLNDISHPDDNKLSDKFYKDCLDGKMTHFQVEKCLRNSKMELIWTRLTASSLLNDEGSMEAMYITFEDITARRNTEVALTAANSKLHLAEFQREEAELRFRNVLEHAEVGIALLDKEGKLVQSNPMLQHMLGFTGEELATRTFNDLANPDEPAEDGEYFGECVAGKRDEFVVEKQFRRNDGKMVWGKLSVSGVRNPDNDFEFAVGVFEDITELKESDGLPKETISIRLRSPEEGFLTTDTEGHVVLMNHVCERILGVKLADVFGKHLDEVVVITQEIRRHRLESPESSPEASDDSLLMRELVLKRPDGQDIAVLHSSRTMLDLEGSDIGMIHVIRDLGELARIEEELIGSGKIDPEGITDSQIASEFENILTNLNILLVPVLAELKAEGDAEKAAQMTRDLSKNLATLTGVSQRSLA